MATRILLTGFGPFGKVQENPSEQVVRQLDSVDIDGVELKTLILSVSFQDAIAEMHRCLRTDGPFDYVLSLGVATKRTYISLERRALNKKHDTSNLDTSDSSVVENAPDCYFTTLPISRLKRCISNATEVPIRMSDNAGSFVCNALFFATLHEIAISQLATKCGFIHIPSFQYVRFGDVVGSVKAVLSLLGESQDLIPKNEVFTESIINKSDFKL